MRNWRFILTIVVIVGGSSPLADNVYGQISSSSPPLPYGSQTTEPVVPLSLASGSPTLSDPNAGAPPSPSSTWPPPGQPMSAPPAYHLDPPNLPAPANSRLWQQTTPDSTSFEKLVQSSWYTRVDYFHWNERVGSADFVNESGALFTLGYERRIGSERFRAEFFAGDMRYDGGLQLDDGSTEPATSRTRYRGFGGEYEHLCEPTWWPDGMFLLGIGSRFWIRDIRGGFGAFSDWSDETQETWWTLYPYVGLERWWSLGSGLELFSSLRVGTTALTYNYSNAYNLPVYPRLGVVGGLEFGLRGQRLSLSGSCEVMTWAQSADQYFSSTDSNGNFIIAAVNQPTSTMFLLGGKLGYSF
jgi:hypothetical protein